MDQDDLEKLKRLAEAVRQMSASASAIKTQNGTFLNGFIDPYKKYFEQTSLVIGRNNKYLPEFGAVPKGEHVHWPTVVPSYKSLESFIDGVIRTETLTKDEQMGQFKEEFFIEEDKPFSAYKIVSDVFSKAVSEVKMVDNYLESSSLDFFIAINSKVDVKAITMKYLPNKPAFKTALTKFIHEWGGTSFEVKDTNFFHDRYIIIDNKEVWHLGPSLNRLGIKPAMLSIISDDVIKLEVIERFDDQWQKASPL